MMGNDQRRIFSKQGSIAPALEKGFDSGYSDEGEEQVEKPSKRHVTPVDNRSFSYQR
jgi:hypothetical protein